jgi:hypothetical protein
MYVRGSGVYMCGWSETCLASKHCSFAGSPPYNLLHMCTRRVLLLNGSQALRAPREETKLKWHAILVNEHTTLDYVMQCRVPKCYLNYPVKEWFQTRVSERTHACLCPLQSPPRNSRRSASASAAGASRKCAKADVTFAVNSPASVRT